MPSIVGHLAAGLLAVSLPTLAHCRKCDDLALQSQPISTAGRSLEPNDLIRLRDLGASFSQSPGSTAIGISPDGMRVAVQLRRAVTSTNAYCLGMVVIDLRSRGDARLVDVGGDLIRNTINYFGISGHRTGVASTITPRWSHDGRWIAFLKSVDGVTQVWRARVDGGGSEPVTNSDFDVLDFVWDQEDEIVYSSQPVLAQVKAAIKKEGDDGFHYDQRFAPRLSNRPSPLEPIELTVFVADPSNKSTRLALPEEAALLKAKDREEAPGDAILVASKGLGFAAWTAPLSADTGSDDVALYVDRGGERIRCDDPACRGKIAGLWWSASDRAVLFLRYEGWGDSQIGLYRWRVGRESPRRFLLTNDLLADCGPVEDGLLCAREGSTRPRYLAIISVTGRERVIFDPNPEFRQFRLGAVERLNWKNNVGFETFGDLVLPPGHKSGQTHPLIVVQYISRGFLRGGTGDEYPIQSFAQRGFAVLSFNRPRDFATSVPTRGSVEFQRAGLTDWADRRSVLSALEEGVKLAIAKGAVDSRRIGITGLSDGASTVQYALINSKMFSAAAMSSCCSEASSFVQSGPSLLKRWTAAGWPKTSELAEDFWKPFSIIRNAGNITTPVLMQLSDDEYLSALGAYSALTDRGKPVDMFVFPGEHHIKWQPRHRLAIYMRNLDWFDFWLNGVERAAPERYAEYERWRSLKAAGSLDR